jgi:hypothetical protein
MTLGRRAALLPRVRPPLALAMVAFALSGCATLQATSEQQSARTAWDRCPKGANLALDSIDANGLIRYRAVSNHSSARELTECLQSTGLAASSALLLSASP